MKKPACARKKCLVQLRECLGDIEEQAPNPNRMPIKAGTDVLKIVQKESRYIAVRPHNWQGDGGKVGV